MSPKPIYTIGHSTRPLETLLALLRLHKVAQLADVRTIPRSRRHPHFNRDALAAALANAHIRYEHRPALGGLRKARTDSINLGFRDGGFRGYADYMQTAEFLIALNDLLAFSAAAPTAIMCAEANPAQCHRSLISDALSIRQVPVLHIISASQVSPHSRTLFARVEGESITYPAVQTSLELISLRKPLA